MSEAHDNNGERLRRIREATKKAEAEASASESAVDAFTQKMVQEIVTVKRQNDALASEVREARQEQQKQAAELDALRSKQQRMEARLHKQQEQLAQQPARPIPSPSDIDARIRDKLLVFKVQLGCIVCGIALVAAAFWLWPNDGEAKPEQPATTHTLERWGK